MKKLSKDEMKKVVGGVMAPPNNWCSATVNCKNGTTVTLVCEHSQAGCVGIDYSDSGDGYAYCEENGGLIFNHCSVQ